MNLRNLEYLVAVADYGTFGKAAAACGVAQPTLSVQLRKMEESLGVALFDRSARTAVLTSAGHQVVTHAREALLHIDRIRSIAAVSGNIVRIGVFPTLAQYLLPHVMTPLRHCLGDAEVHWTEKKSASLEALLAAGELDAALLAEPFSAPAGFGKHPLFVERFQLAMPQNHPLNMASGPAAVTDIPTDELILLDDGHCLRDHVLQVCTSIGATVNPRVRASSLETLRHMVAAGLGVTLLPELAVLPPAPELAGLAWREFSEPAPVRRIVMVYRDGHPYADVLEAGRLSMCEATAAVLPPTA